MEVGCSKDRSQKMFYQPSLHNINDVVRVWNVKPEIRLVECQTENLLLWKKVLFVIHFKSIKTIVSFVCSRILKEFSDEHMKDKYFLSFLHLPYVLGLANNDKQKQTKTNDKQRQTTNNDKLQITANKNNKQWQTTNDDKWQTMTNDKLLKHRQTMTSDNKRQTKLFSECISWKLTTLIPGPLGLLWPIEALTILTDQWGIKKIIAEFALFTWSCLCLKWKSWKCAKKLLRTRCQIWCTIEAHRDPSSKVLSEW